MATATPIQTKCGFCLQTDGDLEDPVRLPCSHVHCKSCLKGAYKVTKVVKCPTCSVVFDVFINRLPSAKVKTDTLTTCDTCSKKGVTNNPAVIYCTTCSKKFCDKHRQFHDEVHDDHPSVGMEEYRSKATKLEIRMCDKHGDQPYNAGCKSCLTLCCVKCLSGLGNCSKGTHHQLISIKELLAELMKEINKLKEDLLTKEGEISSLIKKTTAAVSEYESQTNQMIQLLHKTRDEQIKAITVEYQRLEASLVAQRIQAQTDMSKFSEEQLERELSQLNLNRLRIEAQLKQSHEVDIVSGYNKIKVEINNLLDQQIPSSNVQNVKLQTKGANRKVELQLVKAEDIQVSIVSSVSAHVSLPSTWIPPLDKLSQVTLSRESEEFRCLSASLRNNRQGIPFKVQKITRIQNPEHYKKYIERRKLVARRLGKQESEVETIPLWLNVDSGEVSEVISGKLIRRTGGIRQGAGRRQQAMGVGCRTTVELADDWYNSFDCASTALSIIQVRMVTGKSGAAVNYRAGVNSWNYERDDPARDDPRAIPYRPPPMQNKSTQQFDSLVDNVHYPQYYIVCDDAAVYPEYLIEYTSTY